VGWVCRIPAVSRSPKSPRPAVVRARGIAAASRCGRSLARPEACPATGRRRRCFSWRKPWPSGANRAAEGRGDAAAVLRRNRRARGRSTVIWPDSPAPACPILVRITRGRDAVERTAAPRYGPDTVRSRLSERGGDAIRAPGRTPSRGMCHNLSGGARRGQDHSYPSPSSSGHSVGGPGRSRGPARSRRSSSPRALVQLDPTGRLLVWGQSG
jgi:hypothetical protein